MGTSISQIIQVTTPALGVVPGPATGLTVSSITAASVVLTWTPPATGTPPLQYQPQLLPAGGSAYQNIGALISTATVTVTGLAANTSYQFHVVTYNATGSSTSAAVSATTLAIPPGVPTGLAVVGASGQTDITLTWNAPTTGSLPFSYQIMQRTPTGVGSFVNGPTTSTTTLDVTGLTVGTSYDFTVSASNAAGSGASSAALTNVLTAAPSAVAPSAPLNLASGAITQTSIVVSWAAPVQGTPPVSYTAQYRPH